MDDRLLALERALAAQAEQNTALLSQLGEQRSRVEALEVQKALAEKDLAVQRLLAAKDLEIQRLREGAGGGGRSEEAMRSKVLALEQKTRSLELEKKDATIEALRAKTRLTARELKALKSKTAVAAKGAYVEPEEQEEESGDEAEEQDPVQRAVEIGQRKHVNLKRVDRLWLVKWTGPQRMHAVHFNHLTVFVRAVSSVVLEWEDDVDDTEEEEEADEERVPKKKRGGGRKRKRHGHVNKERLALLELERPMAYEDVAALVRALCDLDLLIGPVYLQSEFQVWPKGKDAPINPGRWMVRVSWLRTVLANDNFMRQSRQYIEDYIMGRKDRHFSCDDCWLFLTKLAD
jgi:hypothetical protein